MIHLSQAVVVEGKYDKIRLSSLLDATILVTGGFRIYKDKEQLAFMRRLARDKGLLILTDSDAAGFRIRNYIKSAIPDGKIFHAYIPEILGKEKRKQTPSKEGTLGVEGMDREILIQSLKRSGVLFEEREKRDPVTRLDFYEAGLSGGEESAKLRQELLSDLELPHYLSATALLDAVNALMQRDAFLSFMEKRKTGK